MWPTPDAAPEAPNKNSNRVNGPKALGEAAKLWPQPKATDWKDARRSANRGGAQLPEEAKHWQTPSVSDTTGGHLSRGGERADELLLKRQAQLWATPTGRDFKAVGENSDYEKMRQKRRLAGDANHWASPTAHDGRRPGSEADSTQGRNLKREAELSLQAQQTAQAGHPGSPDTPVLNPQSPVLNPRFVEALMGWPSGLSDFASSETESSPWWPRMRGVLSQLGWED